MAEYFKDEEIEEEFEDESSDEADDDDDELEEMDIEYEDFRELTKQANKLIQEYKIKNKEYIQSLGLTNLKLFGDPHVEEQEGEIDKFEYMVNGPNLRYTVIGEQGRALSKMIREWHYKYEKSLRYFRNVVKELGSLFNSLHTLYEKDVKEMADQVMDEDEVPHKMGPGDEIITQEEVETFMYYKGARHMEEYYHALEERNMKRASMFKATFVSAAASEFVQHPNPRLYANKLFISMKKKFSNVPEHARAKIRGEVMPKNMDIDSSDQNQPPKNRLTEKGLRPSVEMKIRNNAIKKAEEENETDEEPDETMGNTDKSR